MANVTVSANVDSLLQAADYAAFKVLLSLGNVEDTAVSTWSGSANITTVGTIGTGTWQGTIIAPAYLGSGTPGAGNYLRGDGTWATPTASAAWGGITGTLSSQTDLQGALDAKLALAGGTMTGTITFDAAQTFDGRDLSVDGAKLDGIEAGATADQTAADIRALGFFDTSNDGAASGLDADLLDGQHASAFQPADAELTALAGLTSAADKLPYFTGSGTAGLADFSSFGRTLVDDASASAARTTLELSAAKTRRITAVFDGGGSAIATGTKAIVSCPVAGTITSVRMLADVSGSAVVDVWKDTYANFPPTDADSITASAVPTISAATKSEDATLTGWTTSVAAGDTLIFNVDSCSTITRLTVELTLTV